MGAIDFRTVDLNLLAPLRVLLVERHVTRSAEKLGVSQPAMSASLARSRTLFRDQLLVRGAKGLVLTPRAEQLLEQLDHVMAVIGEMVSLPMEFAPETSQRTFTLHGNDFVELILVPPLMAALATDAPSVQIMFKGPDFKDIEDMMANGGLDLAVGYFPVVPGTLIKRAAFRERLVCVARQDHPLLRDCGLSLDRYMELQHAQLFSGTGALYAATIDTALAAKGLVRKIAVWEPSYLAIADVVARTDLISTMPTRLATYLAKGLPIAIYDLPLPLPLPGPDYAMYWHPRSQADEGHKWLRERVAALLRAKGSSRTLHISSL
jgi:DNA-binding transcriptional LysR family regulator